MTKQEFVSIFCHRKYPFAVQKEDGSYNKLVSNLDMRDLDRHFKGLDTIGTYTIAEDNTVRYVCLDADTPRHGDLIRDKLKELKIPYLWEKTGGRGWHIWIIFDKPIDSKKTYQFGQQLRQLINPNLEVFPKQESLKNGELGNLVKVPLGIHQKYGNRSTFDRPIKEVKVPYLSEIPKLPEVATTPKQATVSPKSETQFKMPCTEKMLQGCVEGSRDETALRLAVRFYRSGLPQDIAWKLMQKFNSNCKPPLGEGDLERKLDQGYKGKYSLGCNNPLIEQYCDPSCGLYAKVKKINCEIDELIPDKGFLSYYLKYNSNNDAPKLFHLLTGLFLISSIVKNQLYLNPFGASNIYPNLYFLFVAPSGHRKSTAINIGKDLLTNFDESLLLPDSVASYEAYLNCFVNQPQSSMVISEFSRFMRRLSREQMGGVKDILTEIYDCPSSHKVFSKGEGAFNIEYPCINLMAATTPAWLEGNTKIEDWQEGFMSRFIIAYATREDFKGISERTVEEKQAQEKIISWFDRVEKITGSMDFSEVQDELNEEVKNKYKQNKEEILTGFYNRAADYLIKFSMLYQVSLNYKEQKISSEALGYAKRLFSYIENNYVNTMSELSLTRESKDINKVYRAVKHSGSYGISRSILLQKSGFYSNKLSSVLTTLKESGKVIEKKNGATRYFKREK